MKAVCKLYDDDGLEICEMDLVDNGCDGTKSTITFKNNLRINSIGFRRIWEIWRGLERDLYG